MTKPDHTQRAFALEDVMLLDPRALARGFSPLHGEDEEDCDDGVDMRDGVAVVSIDGPLSQRGGWWWDGYESIEQRLQRALASSATSVLLKINSPGGVVAGCFEAARRMREACVASGKPVFAYVDEMACSAAYALACVADEIVLPPSGTVGSIGVIATACDRTKANEINGINVQLVTSGERKADLHPDAPLSEDALAALNARVMHLAGLFTAWVAVRRGTTADAIAAQQAAVFDGANAVTAGLANRVGSLQDALSLARASSARTAPTPTSGGVSPAPRGTMNPELLALLGLPATASEQDAASAIRGAREASNAFCAVTGQNNHQTALGAVLAWKAEAAKVPALEAKLAEQATQLEAQQKAAIAAERKALLDDAADLNRPGGPLMSAAERKAFDTDPALASTGIETLRATLRHRTGLSVKTAPVAPSGGPQSATNLTPEDLHVAALLGVDPKKLTAAPSGKGV